MKDCFNSFTVIYSYRR